jgi:hypothetical protein
VGAAQLNVRPISPQRSIDTLSHQCTNCRKRFVVPRVYRTRQSPRHHTCSAVGWMATSRGTCSLLSAYRGAGLLPNSRSLASEPGWGYSPHTPSPGLLAHGYVASCAIDSVSLVDRWKRDSGFFDCHVCDSWQIIVYNYGKFEPQHVPQRRRAIRIANEERAG